MRPNAIWFAIVLAVSIPVLVWLSLGIPSSNEVGFHSEPWLEPQSIEEVADIHPIIAIGTVNRKFDTVTVTHTMSDTWLTEVAPDGDAFGSEEYEYSEFAFEVTDLLKTDGSFEEGVTVTLRFGGPLAGTNGYPPDVGSSYILLGELDNPGDPTTVWPTGISYGMIQADDLNGDVLYADDEAVGWAAGMTVQEFVDDLVDELGP